MFLKYITYEEARIILGSFRCEGKGDDHLILCDGDIGQIWWLHTEICHVNGAGSRSRYGISHHFSLHIKRLFIGFAVHGHVTDQLEMHSLPITVAAWQSLCAN